MNNFERMMELVTEFFDTRHDPDQISVTPGERTLLEKIHPATLSETSNEEGPIVWILIIPTTSDVMNRFIRGAITEKQLLQQTRPGDTYDTIYLCSASVLPEFRKKGLAKKLALEAIAQVRKDHPVHAVFYWPYSQEGKLLARSIAVATGLALYERTK